MQPHFGQILHNGLIRRIWGSMASQDMLKKLLDEFVEKEALVSEELKVVTEQIEELEMRLEKCRMRLGSIGTDRNRVMEIKQRYSGGVFYQRAEQAPMSVPAAQVSTAPAQPPQPVAPKKAEPTPVPPPVQQQPQPQPEPSYTDSVAAAMSPEISTAKPDVTPRSTISGINSLLGARRNETSQVSFDQQDYQQQLPTPGQPVQQPQPQPALPPVAQPEPEPEPAPQPQPQAQQPASSDKVVDIEENQAEDDSDNSDTVKSINDALRSLFR
jgi:hypothetical protein